MRVLPGAPNSDEEELQQWSFRHPSVAASLAARQFAPKWSADAWKRWKEHLDKPRVDTRFINTYQAVRSYLNGDEFQKVDHMVRTRAAETGDYALEQVWHAQSVVASPMLTIGA